MVALVLSLALLNPQSVKAQGYITITYPADGSTLTTATVEIGGIIMGAPGSWIGLYLADQGLVLTDADCHMTTSSGYVCLWVINPNLNGNHLIMTSTHLTDGSTGIFSQKINVKIANQSTIIPPPSSPTPTPNTTSQSKTKITPTQTNTPAAIVQPTPTPEMTTTNVPVPGRPDLAKIPVAVPISTPSSSPTPRDMVTDSQVLTTIEFQLDREKPFHLEKIEARKTSAEQKFLLFAGKSYPESLIKITIKSQPLVMTATADAQGIWQYTLDKPLEPGKHEVYLEVNHNGQITQSGPYPFNIAQAQAGFENPTGASLNLVDPQKQALRNYLYLAAGLVGLAILVLLIFLYFKKVRKLRTASPPIKEPSGS